ncbi:MAG: putative metal-binding motif-containing protein [Microthrixaceae bacterium]|nr:putative metal-binding motif-containing protein [Microthrixaceae bacterium]
MTITVYIDDDGDGVSPPADCNDNSASTYPGAADTLDASGTDSNCDGVDGVLADTILVAGTGGSDVAGCGQAVANPCQSIAFGISEAGASRHAVLVTGNGTAYGLFAPQLRRPGSRSAAATERTSCPARHDHGERGVSSRRARRSPWPT